MIRGGFDSYKRPIIRGEVSHGPNNTTGVSFLIDTGAVDTIIMPSDARRLRVNYSILGPQQSIRGLGGSIKGYEIDLEIVFLSAPTTYTYYVNALIVDPSTGALPYPSILGLQVWSRWELTIHHAANKVAIDPVSNDGKYP